MSRTMAYKETNPLRSIVAFEGRSETISTQLRLLPTSPQVLILPNVQCHFPAPDSHQVFDTRLYVKQVHDALMARNETARAFLQGSTAANKRLVFMNGGTPSAQALCVKAIMDHETGGRELEACAIFDDLIRDGAAGLQDDWCRRRTASPCQAGHGDDLITRAMRAADALDRQTANLKPSNDLDLTVPARQRSSSLPLYGYSDAFGDAAPFIVFGARSAKRDNHVENLITSRTSSLLVPQPDELAQKLALLGSRASLSAPYSPSCIGETYDPATVRDRVDADPSSPLSEVFSIRTLDNVVYGEASVLDVRQSVGKGTLARVKSLDRIYPVSPKFRDLCILSESWLVEPDTPLLHRPRSLMVFRDDRDSVWSRLSSFERPRTVVVNPNMPVVKVAPVPHGKKCAHVKARSTYVDRGTGPDNDVGEAAPFQPVFACTEDLVVYLKEGAPDGVLESAINAFKDGRYPLPANIPVTSKLAKHADKSPPETPSSRSSDTLRHSAVTLDEDIAISVSRNLDDYDPFAYIQPTAQLRKVRPLAPKVAIVSPPTTGPYSPAFGRCTRS